MENYIQGIIIVYLTIINIAAFAAFGIDKAKAKRGKWRTPEKTLIGMAVLGGSVGALIGMGIWHHKTKHKKFTVGIPIILLLQIAFGIFLIQ